MGSTRLPSKVMTPINGKPMIGYQIDRLLMTGLPLIIATSEDKNNDILVEYVTSLGVEVFRGSEDNVLERYYEAAKLYNATDIIRITGDNPLVDADFLLKQLSIINHKTRRYYLFEGIIKKFPLGMSFEMFSFELLEEACQKAKLKSEEEHVTPYMHQNMPGDIEIIEFETEIDFPDARLTVDTPQDLELMKRLIGDHQCHLKNTEEIIKILVDNRDLTKINRDIVQKSWCE